jgi:hypothetical protein
MNYQTGHVDPWWDDSFKTLPYERNPFPMDEDTSRWEAQGYNNVTLNGKSYDMRHTMPDYAQPFFTLFDMQNVGLCFMVLNTMEMLPLHRDFFKKYIKKFEIQKPQNIRRAVVFLEDWKSGHYFEIDGKPLLPWRRGDWVSWLYDVEHFAGNFGIESRYTLQITGYDNQA